MMTFNQISNMLESVESKFAASSQVSQSQVLPAIADTLCTMEMIVAAVSQDCVQSESGYDSSASASQEDLVSLSLSASTPSSASLPASTPSLSSTQSKGDKFISHIKDAICRLAPAGVYDVAKAKRRRKRKDARRAKRIVPTEFLVLWQTVKEEDVLQTLATPPCPYPKVDWSKVNSKLQASIPLPGYFPVQACSEDPSFYAPQRVHGNILPSQFEHFQKQPFGLLPGFQTNLGVIAPPAQHISHGYVWVPDKGWVLKATVGAEEEDVKRKSPPPRSRMTRSSAPWRRRRG